jgi:transcription elongation factor Elf1
MTKSRPRITQVSQEVVTYQVCPFCGAEKAFDGWGKNPRRKVSIIFACGTYYDFEDDKLRRSERLVCRDREISQLKAGIGEALLIVKGYRAGYRRVKDDFICLECGDEQRKHTEGCTDTIVKALISKLEKTIGEEKK